MLENSAYKTDVYSWSWDPFPYTIDDGDILMVFVGDYDPGENPPADSMACCTFVFQGADGEDGIRSMEGICDTPGSLIAFMLTPQ